MNFTKQNSELPGFQITPMLDVVFLLLTFVVTTSIYSQGENEIDIQLPTAETGVIPDRPWLRGLKVIVVSNISSGALDIPAPIIPITRKLLRVLMPKSRFFRPLKISIEAIIMPPSAEIIGTQECSAR